MQALLYRQPAMITDSYHLAVPMDYASFVIMLSIA